MRLPQVITLVLALAAIAPLSALGLRNAQWKAASDLEAASYLMRERKESVLIHGSNEMAGAVIATFLGDVQTVTELLSRRLSKTLGGASTLKISGSSLQGIVDSALPESRSEYVRRLDADNQRPALQALAKEGFRVDSVEEVRIVSKKFNALDRRDASSTHVAHVVDAAGFLDRRGTVVILYRLDRETRWGWSNVHDLFSFGRHKVLTRLVDVSLFEAVAETEGLEPKAVYVGTFGQKQFQEYLDEWRRLRNSLPAR